MTMAVCGVPQKFNGVLVFVDQCFRCKESYLKLNWVFRFGYVQFNNDTAFNIAETNVTK